MSEDKLQSGFPVKQVRPLYMHLYGGVYADLDFIALRPMQDLFEQQGNNAQVFLGQDCGVELNHFTTET